MNRPLSRALLAVLWIWGTLSTVRAEDVQVNVYTTGAQVAPSVSMAPDGDFVVVWQSEGFADADSDRAALGRLFSSDGSSIGDDFLINTYTTDPQVAPSVGMTSDGSFVVAWSSGTSGYSSVEARRFDSSGAALGAQFAVSNVFYTRSPDVGTAPDGRFVVAWETLPYPSVRVEGKVFDADGVALGMIEPSETNFIQSKPAAAMDSDGNVVLAWGSSDGDGGIRARRFQSDGTPIGDDFQVSSYTTGSQSEPDVGTASNGDFVVVWQSIGSSGTDSDSTSIQARRFGSDGAAIGGEFQVNAYTTGAQYVASVGVEASGNFVVAWTSTSSAGTDSDGTSVQARRFDADGTALGDDFQVNTFTASGQSFPALGISESGRFVAAWQSSSSPGTDSSSSSTQMSNPALTRLLFEDGFESGDLSAWSGSTP